MQSCLDAPLMWVKSFLQGMSRASCNKSKNHTASLNKFPEHHSNAIKYNQHSSGRTASNERSPMIILICVRLARLKKGKCFPVAGSEKGTFEQTHVGCSYICGARACALLLTQPKQLYPIRKYSPKSRRTLGQCPGSTVEACSWNQEERKPGLIKTWNHRLCFLGVM